MAESPSQRGYRGAINATDWQPLSGMMKKRCGQSRYWFAVSIAEAKVTRPGRPSVGQ